MCEGSILASDRKPRLSTVYRITLAILIIGILADAALTFMLGNPAREANPGIASVLEVYGMFGLIIPVSMQLSIFIPLAYISNKVALKHDLTGRIGLSILAIYGVMHMFAGSTWIWGPR
jgi:hypothetical protein